MHLGSFVALNLQYLNLIIYNSKYTWPTVNYLLHFLYIFNSQANGSPSYYELYCYRSQMLWYCTSVQVLKLHVPLFSAFASLTSATLSCPKPRFTAELSPYTGSRFLCSSISLASQLTEPVPKNEMKSQYEKSILCLVVWRMVASKHLL